MLPSLSINKKEHLTGNKIIDQSLLNYFKSFPDEETVQSILTSSFIINSPMHQVGGDGYWLHKEDDHFFLVVFDCMGHGRLASIMTRLYISTIEQVIQHEKFSDPADILHQIHSRIKQQFQDKGALQLGSGVDIAVINYNPKERVLLYSGAKMDLISISNGELERIRADKLQVGEIFDREHSYSNVEIDLYGCDPTSFFLYSDGVTDLFGGPKNKKLGFKNLSNILLPTHAMSVQDSKEFIHSELDKWMGSNTQTDDLLLISFTL